MEIYQTISLAIIAVVVTAHYLQTHHRATLHNLGVWLRRKLKKDG